MPSTKIVADDPDWPLEQWLKFINEQIATYGPKATMHTDAGYNNASLIITEAVEEKKDATRKRNTRRPS